MKNNIFITIEISEFNLGDILKIYSIYILHKFVHDCVNKK